MSRLGSVTAIILVQCGKLTYISTAFNFNIFKYDCLKLLV